MSDKSTIEWTDATWNPIRGARGKWSCVKVSPGCANCYAERVNRRFSGARYTYSVGADSLRLDEKVLTEPLRWKKPRRVFVCSMTDLFEERVPDHWIDRIFAVMAAAPWHTFQVLTKRADRMRDYMKGMTPPDPARWDAARRPLWLWAKQYQPRMVEGIGIYLANAEWPRSNIWLGVSVEDQRRAEERVPSLLQTPTAVRFVSAEPLLGPVNLDRWVPWRKDGIAQQPPPLDWVIVGGESGPGARPMEVAWARRIVADCRSAGVPVFVKQLGARPQFDERAEHADWLFTYIKDSKGGDPSEWPEDLRVREYP